MVQVVTATFEDGVLKPTEPLALPEHAHVRLTIDLVEEHAPEHAPEALTALEELWRHSTLRSIEPRLSRDQLHERR
jgi:predicted DNA-binding antitoxin AbrB/MazE fold protein